MKYLLTGGGTGGHVYPALAIADEIRRRHQDARFLYVGMRSKLESRIVPARGYAIRFVQSRPYPRSGSPLALACFVAYLTLGVLQGMVILLRYRPGLIIATGGYGSAPVLFAHAILTKIGLSRARVFVYEPNAYPGLLNQAVGRIAHRIGVAFERAGRWFDMKRVAVVGYPVRREVLETDSQQARQAMGIPPDRKVVLAFGGSTGSRIINEALVRALPRLRQRDDLLVLHVTGRYAGPDYDAVRDTAVHLQDAGISGDTSSWYRSYDYLDQIEFAYRAADLVLCRGGAGTLTEVTVCGLPALIVPLPTAAEDHQAMNARELERQGAARVLYQRAYWDDGRIDTCLPADELADAILELVADDQQRQRMARRSASLPVKDSLGLILRELESLASSHRPPPLDLEYPLPDQGLPADPNALLRVVRERLAEVGGPANLEPSELHYLCYQADRLLVSQEWYEIPLGRRNVGVKLVGCLDYTAHLSLLVSLLTDRHTVSWVKRLAGGDYRHGGLLRRNVIELGLVPLGVTTATVRKALLQALQTDPYYEVRAAAAQALGSLWGPDRGVERVLIQALDDSSPAVVKQALQALGRTGTSPDLLPRLRRFFLAEHWPYRLHVVEALTRLLEREVLNSEDVQLQLDDILPTSSFFTPEFPLNEKLRRLAEMTQTRIARHES